MRFFQNEFEYLLFILAGCVVAFVGSIALFSYAVAELFFLLFRSFFREKS